MAKAGGDTRSVANADKSIEDSLVAQMTGVAAALWATRQRAMLVALLFALAAVVGATAYAQVLLNAWNRPFYDALGRKDVPAFLAQLVVFAEIGGALLVLNVAQTWLNQKSKLTIRKGLAESLMTAWLAPLRGVRLSQAGEIGENPDSASTKTRGA